MKKLVDLKWASGIRLSGSILIAAVVSLVLPGCGGSGDKQIDKDSVGMSGQNQDADYCALESPRYLVPPMFVTLNDCICGEMGELDKITGLDISSIAKEKGQTGGCVFYISWRDRFADSGMYPNHTLPTSYFTYFVDMENVTATIAAVKPGVENRKVEDRQPPPEYHERVIGGTYENLGPPNGELDYCNPPTSIKKLLYVDGKGFPKTWLELPLIK